MDFKDWAPLRFVDSDLLSRVRLAYVFGTAGLEALIITDEDEVLACGKNEEGCLGLDNEAFQVAPVNIPELEKQKVKGFAATVYKAGSFVCAYTFTGTMYYWCKNFVALTTTKPTSFPEFSKKVSQVACGNYHCSILSSDGEVFCFGFNSYGQLGNGSTITLSAPTLVQGDLKGKIVIKISCGALFSVCVLDNGMVYAWGCNSQGQLGWSTQSHANLNKPTRVPDMNDFVIKKIICGYSHVLALNNLCELFSWGNNEMGALGLGDDISRCRPTKIESIGKVINIAAVRDSSTSVAMTENFEVYMWGVCGGLVLKDPTKTQFDTMYEVFAYFHSPRVMVKPMKRPVHHSLSVGESIKYSFGHTESSDLTIVAEGKEIFVHKVILKLRSNYFESLLKEPWVQEDQKSIVIDQNYEGIHAYLQYIYSGHLKATPEVALESLKIANEYHDVVFKKVCEKSIRRGITVENVANLFSLALKLDAKDLIQYCVSFASHHIGEVIETAGFSEWDKDTYKAFISECYKRNIFRFAL